MKSMQDLKKLVKAYVGVERQDGRPLGPFQKHCFPQFQVSPLRMLKVRWVSGG